MQAEIMSLRSGQWLQVIREQAQSGQTAEQWCRVHHTARSTYYRWKKAPPGAPRSSGTGPDADTARASDCQKVPSS